MKEFVGLVVNNKSQKTATVKIDWLAVHPRYKKRIKRTTKFLVEDPFGVKIGDAVRIVEVRPISSRKHFLIKEVLTKDQRGVKRG